MIAFYDNKPSVLEAVGNGSYVYRFNIHKVQKQSQAENDPKTVSEVSQEQWQCEEVTVWSPLTSDKITEKVITEKWENNHEQKLINDFNAAYLNLVSKPEAKKAVDAYTAYLNERSAVKAQIDRDCKELGIL